MTDQTVPSVGVDRDGGLAVITIDDGKANAISFQVEGELDVALRDAADNGDAAVLAGRPGRFSAGYDLSEMMAGGSSAIDLMTGGAELLIRLLSHPRPVVAACTGHAIAAGAAVLLVCDMRVGLDGPFKIGFNEVGIGLPLPSLVTTLGRERLNPRHLIAATRGASIYGPVDAADVGFLDRVIDSDVVDSAVDEARHLASLPADAYRLTKESAQRDLLARLNAAVRLDVELVASLTGN